MTMKESEEFTKKKNENSTQDYDLVSF